MGEQPPGEPDRGEPTLAEQFWRVARTLRGQSRAALAEWDISPSLYRAIATLARQGPIRPSALSEHLRIAPRSVTEVVDALEERGLAQRRPDTGDRRATIVELTDTGRNVEDRVQATRSAESDAFFARLSERDRHALARILRTLSD